MTQRSFFWTTGGTGDGAALAQDLLCKIFKALLGDGVNRDYLNELEVTVTGPATVSVNTGAAWVDGHPYENDSAATVNLTIPAGGTGTTGGYIVLIRDYDARTIRLGKVQSVDGVPDLPTLTQGSGAASAYHFPLASYTIADTSGTVTLEHPDDENPLEFLHPAFLIITAMIAAAAITKAKLNDDVVDDATLELDASDGLRIKAAGVGTAQLALDSVDDTIAGNKVLVLADRQGALANPNFGAAGTDVNNYTPGATRMRVGTRSVTVGAGSVSASLIVTFPTQFEGPPTVIPGAASSSGVMNASKDVPTAAVDYSTITATGCTIWVTRADTTDTSGNQNVIVTWWAIGEEYTP